MLILLSILALFNNHRNKFFVSFVAGLLIGFAFYTKFIAGLYILFQSLFLLLYFKKKTFKPFLGYIAGVISVLLIFSLFGYYFWLTYITGNAYAKQYIMDYPISNLKIFTDFLYFGPAILILILVLLMAAVFKFKENNIRMITIPLVASIFLYCIFYLNVSALNRYFMVYVPVVALLLYPLAEKIKLGPKDIIMTATASYIFYCLIVYL